jgi:L-fuculose-phosphate aldolase|tara:strand:- start:2144 stop:2806 length:663 start_codon:yes stop_codon:yes gene_type:complete
MNDDLKKQVIEYSIKLNKSNLSPLRSGNLSIRAKIDDEEGFYITPSGVKYENLKISDIVFLSINKEYDNLTIVNSSLNPSSEWRFHQDIYKKKSEAKAIVHTHSPHATAISTHQKSIPPFHYMIALMGGDDIKCAEYATFGTKELSQNIIKALENRKACLMANHGQIAFGENLSKAFELAQEVENICHQYFLAIKLGEPKNLTFAEMQKILEKVKGYKRA